VSTPEDHEPAPEDRELDALLSRSGRVHAAWREASVEEPPATLDDAIRAAARRAVRAGPRPAGGSFVSRWRVPMSIAAVLVVSATLTLVLTDRGEHLPGADLRPAPAALDAPSAADASARDAAKVAEGDERLRNAPSAAAAPPAREQAMPPIAQGSGSLAKQREAVAPESRAPAQQSAPSQPAGSLAQPDARPTQQDSAPAARRDVQAPAAPQAEPYPALEARTKAEALADRAARSELPIVAARAPADAAGVAANAAPRASTEVAAPMPAKSVARAEAESMKREAQSAAVAPGLEPKAWVERILVLQHEGKVQEAQRSLHEFRRRYPDYPLPPELAALVKAPAAD